MATAYPHIFLHDAGVTKNFVAPPRLGQGKNIPARDRQEHSARLRNQLDSAWREVKMRQESRTAASLTTKDGMYVEFEGKLGYDLVTSSLEDRRAGIRLLNVHTIPSSSDATKQITRATVFIPSGQHEKFLNKIKQYTEEKTKKGAPRHADLIQSVENIRLAVLESFWQDEPSLLPEETVAAWCEIWLRVDGDDVELRFRKTANALRIKVQEYSLTFPERIVLLGFATRKQLAELLESSPNVAEFRRAKETAHFFLGLGNREQTEWVNELRSRLQVNPAPAVAVCVLDTGANNGHTLLQLVLADGDCHSVNPDWGVSDHHGHGTLMCGVAAFGDLMEPLQSTQPIHIEHCLESVKILPPRREKNEPALYGDITIQGVSRAEIQTPDRKHIACMAVTAGDGRDRGRPSSWSAAIDKLTSGYDDDARRLFIVSAGNLEPQLWGNYPQSNLDFSIHDPGQSWNALTVGAYTEKVLLSASDLKEYIPLAQPGELSPFSSTSCNWEKKWPVKPDIVFEGGNAAKSPYGFIEAHAGLSLLSTGYEPTISQFRWINATSAATAQAARMAAMIQTRYPNAWPETIRGLMIHSAEWPGAMLRQFFPESDGRRLSKSEYARLLRICGYGVPNVSRALACASNSLTLISQAELQPYVKQEGGSGYSTKDMRLYNLPWPREELLALGETKVTLRVTLSYFIEPGPGEVGWKDRYRYASCGLRFALNSQGESEQDFLKRLNQAAREDGEGKPDTSSGSERWLIGSNGRDIGSVHSDIWEGTAADIATCNLLGVYPVIGWWRERAWLGRYDRKVRYSLIVSLHTPDESIDIYTPVAVRVGAFVPVAV